MTTQTHPARARLRRGWPLERVLFTLAGGMILLSVALSVLVSPWFVLLTAFIGLNQLAFAAVGDCPTSLLLRQMFGLKGAGD